MLTLSVYKVPSYTMDKGEEKFYQNLASGTSTQIDRISQEKIQIAPYPFAKEENDFYQKLSIGSSNYKLSLNDLPEEIIHENILPYLLVNDVYNFSVLSKNFYQSANQYCYRKSREEGYHLSDLEQSEEHHFYIQIYKKEKFAEMIDSTGRIKGKEIREKLVNRLLVITFKTSTFCNGSWLHVYWSFSGRSTVYSLKLRFAKQHQIETDPASLMVMNDLGESKNQMLLSDFLTDDQKRTNSAKKIYVWRKNP